MHIFINTHRQSSGHHKFGELVSVLEMQDEQVDNVNTMKAGQVVTISQTCICMEREDAIGGHQSASKREF